MAQKLVCVYIYISESEVLRKGAREKNRLKALEALLPSELQPRPPGTGLKQVTHRVSRRDKPGTVEKV